MEYTAQSGGVGLSVFTFLHVAVHDCTCAPLTHMDSNAQWIQLKMRSGVF